TYFRLSFSSEIRNPTLSDQYLHLNVGPATLAGHIDQVDSLITIMSFTKWRNINDRDQLEYFNIDAIRPEKVTTLEVGVRSELMKNKFYVDANYYRNSYRDFLGYLVGISVMIIPGPYPDWKNLKVFRYSANSSSHVTTHGASVGINYYPNHNITLIGNYSFNQLNKTVEDDPIIPAYNTPAHKVNLGFTIHELKISTSPFLRNTGFAIQYKWVNGFRFEGSPQFTGYIPSYATVDAQVNVRWEKINTSVKIGATNLLNYKHAEVYGGPNIGRLAYIQMGYRF
nr:TonB-dependent receptor [Bacteroidota bacterium]